MENVPNEILRTPDWLVDHRGGRLRRLHARFGGALCGVPMRRDAYAGMCWLIDGAEVPAVGRAAQRAARLHRPLFGKRARACAVAFLRGGQSGTAHGFRSLAERGGHRHARPSGRACGWASIHFWHSIRLQRSAFPHTAPL